MLTLQRLTACHSAGCATVAEVRKRGDDFWNEFEFYLSDMVVGLVMDVVLVGLMAPTAVLGAPRAAAASGLPLLALLTMQGLSFGARLMLCHVDDTCGICSRHN